MNWPKVELQDIALREKGAIVSGPFGSNISAKYFVEDGIPVIRGNNLTKERTKFIDEGFAYLTETKAAEFRNCIAVSEDIIFTAAGSIGQVGMIPPDARYTQYVISNKQLRVRLDRSRVNPNFVYSWLSSPLMVRYLENMNNGGAVPLLNLGIIRKVPVPLPPIETQRKIADILSTYDDLIEIWKWRRGYFTGSGSSTSASLVTRTLRLSTVFPKGGGNSILQILYPHNMDLQHLHLIK